jgi:predicted lipid-binding transport protein (Tim44 family)
MSSARKAQARKAQARKAQARKSAAPAPAPAQIAPFQQQSGGMLSGLGAIMAQGFAFGTGSSIAHNVVDSMMGSGSSQQAPPQAPPQAPVQQYQAPQQNNVCESDRNALLKCIKEDTPNNCDTYYQALQVCQQNNNLSSL